MNPPAVVPVVVLAGPAFVTLPGGGRAELRIGPPAGNPTEVPS